jgi:hypothetical protein
MTAFACARRRTLAATSPFTGKPYLVRSVFSLVTSPAVHFVRDENSSPLLPFFSGDYVQAGRIKHLWA